MTAPAAAPATSSGVSEAWVKQAVKLIEEFAMAGAELVLRDHAGIVVVPHTEKATAAGAMVAHLRTPNGRAWEEAGRSIQAEGDGTDGLQRVAP